MPSKWLTALLLIGCAGTLHPEAPAQTPQNVLDMARERPIPDPVQARFHIKVRSKPLDVAGGTGGALIFDRPGRGHVAVLGPLGAPLATLTSDGVGLAVDFMRAHRHLVGTDAESVVRETTGGIVGIDDMFGLLVGDLPLDDAKVKSRAKLEDGQVQLVLQGPRKSSISAVLDGATGAPISLIANDRNKRRLLEASYGPFETHGDGSLVPSTVNIEIPQLEMTLELRFKWWKTLDEVPDVFVLDAPDDFETESLERAMQTLTRDLLGGLR